MIAMTLSACAGAAASEESTTTGPSTTTTATTEPSTTTTVETNDSGHHGAGDDVDPTEITAALLAASGFQDVAVAQAAGYGSTIDALGCFQSADEGGMGLHYLKEDLMDDVVDVATPEALVYELDHTGEIVGLVAHEYIVPLEAWTSEEPPELFGSSSIRILCFHFGSCTHGSGGTIRRERSWATTRRCGCVPTAYPFSGSTCPRTSALQGRRMEAGSHAGSRSTR